MKLKLIYSTSPSQQSAEIVVETPVAIGGDIAQLPTQIEQQVVSHVVMSDPSIHPYHALITERQGQISVTDQYLNHPIGISHNRFKVDKVQFTFEIMLPESAAQGNNLNNNSIDLNKSPEQSQSKCQKMVGFLFKRPCDRTSSVNCPHCNNIYDSDLEEDESGYESGYESDYVYYEDYGNYDTWGNTYYRDRHHYHYDSDNRRVEFTEADNAAFESEGDQDFEQNFSAS